MIYKRLLKRIFLLEILQELLVKWLFAFVRFVFVLTTARCWKLSQTGPLFHVFSNSRHFRANVQLFWNNEVRTGISGDFTSIMGVVDVGVYKCIYSYASSRKESSFHVRYWRFPPRVGLPDGSLYALFLFGPVDSGCSFLFLSSETCRYTKCP